MAEFLTAGASRAREVKLELPWCINRTSTFGSDRSDLEIWSDQIWSALELSLQLHIHKIIHVRVNAHARVCIRAVCTWPAAAVCGTQRSCENDCTASLSAPKCSNQLLVACLSGVLTQDRRPTGDSQLRAAQGFQVS